jgi:1,2-dihydroxy-3-keto-5-methylthiopentene dioxygenase
MRAYYFDNVPGDQRLPHDSRKPVDVPKLQSINVEYFNVPVGDHETFVDELATKRAYKSRDVMSSSRELLGDVIISLFTAFCRN